MSNRVTVPHDLPVSTAEIHLKIVYRLTAALAEALSPEAVLDAAAAGLRDCPGVVSVRASFAEDPALSGDRQLIDDAAAIGRPLFRDGAATIPMLPGGRLMAAAVLRFAPSLKPGTGELEFFAAIGCLCGQALERVRLYSVADDARTSLARERAYLDNLLEHMPSGVAIAEAPSGRLVLHNAEALRLLGHPLLSSDDYTGYAQYGAMHDPSTPYRPEEYPIARALRGETVRRERMLYRRGDSTLAYFLVNAAPVRKQDGDIVAAVSTFDDVSGLIATQHALAASSERLSRVLESTTDAVLAVDSSWRITYMNRRAHAAIGHGRDLTGLVLWDAFPDAIGSVFEVRYRAAMAEARPAHFEAYYEPFQSWYELHAYPDRGGLIIYFRDINERKAAEQERERLIESLQQSEADARFRLAEIEAIYESAPVGLCILDDHLRFRRVNRRFAEMNGWPAEAHIGKTPGELAPDLGGVAEEMFRRILESGKPLFDHEICGTTPAEPGQLRYWSENWIPMKDESGRVVGISVSAEEITERKHIEQALRRSQERLALAIESTELGMFDFDPQSGKLEWSAETKRHFGLPAWAEVDYGTFVRGLHPDDRERVHELVQDVLRPGSDGRYATEFRTLGLEDAQERWITAWGRVFFDERRPVRFIGVTRDITERKRIEEQLRHAQKLESIGVLAGGVAHDFNNLLATIMGSASLLLEDVPPASAPLATGIVRASERAAELTRQLLAYAGKGRYVLEEIDLSHSVRAMTELLHASIPRKVTLEENLDPALPAIEADPGQIHQIVMNLVLNAAEAVPENQTGTVSIRTGVERIDARSAAIDDLSHAPIAPGSYVYLEVSDTGIGMDAATRARIFDPFFTTKFTGRGLGLPALAGVVRAHRGAVRVTSAPGRGTTFRVYLPAGAGHARPTPAGPAASEGTARGTVLVVDDEAMVRKFIREALERKGYRVLTAVDGREAVQLLEQRRESIDLVLLDLVMPAMGGEEVAAFLAATQPEVKVLLMSGYSENEAERLFAGRPIAAFLQKPFAPARLAERIQEVLRR